MTLLITILAVKGYKPAKANPRKGFNGMCFYFAEHYALPQEPLKATFASLKRTFASLKETFASLKTPCESLKEICESLKTTCESLKRICESLKAPFVLAKVLHESAKVIWGLLKVQEGVGETVRRGAEAESRVINSLQMRAREFPSLRIPQMK